MAGGVERRDGQRVRADAERREVEIGVELPGRGIERDRDRPAAVESVGQTDQRRPGRVGGSREPRAGTQRVAVGETGQRDRRRAGIERETEGERRAGVAARVAGGQRQRMHAIGGAVEREGRRHAEVAVGIEGDGRRRRVVERTLQYGDTGERVEHPAADGDVAAGDESVRGIEQQLRRLRVGAAGEGVEDLLPERAAGGEPGLVGILEVDAAVDAAPAGFLGSVMDAGKAALDAGQALRTDGEAGARAESAGEHRLGGAAVG
ncbi:MAG: hypothetical protein AW09_000701 [Candidatus Accumulibacter phosphatis]|uniref:Uncharacterized protein n=1 Tax=Candidatus Accumulibacter phosphatis TaxID=327160 RepID=A0A080MA73_9PROT|nr:MAG: hypothetical protein AW09_000701 [Candidatus Accumulibacter phosphatis]